MNWGLFCLGFCWSGSVTNYHSLWLIFVIELKRLLVMCTCYLHWFLIFNLSIKQNENFLKICISSAKSINRSFEFCMPISKQNLSWRLLISHFTLVTKGLLFTACIKSEFSFINKQDHDSPPKFMFSSFINRKFQNTANHKE